ncbi:Crp/Fnr family transcriptional regulator [Paradesertivirga mongoliensis]|uniref:Crp/Fnr family transcriptional regulator n=1 Tax=Paradesertivirga mongoliensis TaxID=2100740 RepID=A0ABW4ZSQ5_9SPHI|nr:Crp/Fnr family transcriptional regulator [Pedobacter mongoliensis]
MKENFRSFCESIISFNDEEWQAMEKCLSIKRLRKNEHFLLEGEVCYRMGFVTEGFTRLYFLVDGEEVTKDFCFENNFTGSVASFQTQRPAQFNVVAMEDTTLITFGFSPLQSLVEKYHCWSNFIRIVLGYFAIRKENREISFLLNSAEQRYMGLVADNPQILQRVALKYIASYLGLSPETVSRIRNKTAHQFHAKLI